MQELQIFAALLRKYEHNIAMSFAVASPSLQYPRQLSEKPHWLATRSGYEYPDAKTITSCDCPETAV